MKKAGGRVPVLPSGQGALSGTLTAVRSLEQRVFGQFADCFPQRGAAELVHAIEENISGLPTTEVIENGKGEGGGSDADTSGIVVKNQLLVGPVANYVR